MPYSKSTTQLPAALRERVENEIVRGFGRQPQAYLHRKEARKRQRHERKHRKAIFFSRPSSTHLEYGNGGPVDDGPQSYEGRRKRMPRMPGPDHLPERLEAPKTTRPQRDHTKTRNYEPSPKAQFPRTLPSRKADNSTAHRRDDPEDARIAWLESKLGTLGKDKTYSFGDGLDDLMEDLDRIVPKFEALSYQSDVVEFESFNGFSDAGESSSAGSSWEAAFEGFEDASQAMETETERDSKVDNRASPIIQPETRYVPPHLRRSSSGSSLEMQKLTRQLKGLLNRLSEQNIASILASIEDIYRVHPRNAVTSTLAGLIIEGITSQSSLLDGYVVLHASLVACMHKIFGVQLAAYFIHLLTTTYDQKYQASRISSSSLKLANEHEVRSKECVNLIILLSELYNFDVVSGVLVFDIVRNLLDSLDEFDVELLVKILRHSGQKLRQDDPSALKEISNLVQMKMSTKKQSTISSRTRFMVEILMNLSSNKAKKNNTPQDSLSATRDRIKKFLSGMNKKYHLLAHEPLRITLDDLRSEKEKWWLAESAWRGDPLLHRVQVADHTDTTEISSKREVDALMTLARKQGMNTDVRRSVFIAVMSSDDYVDACERLSQLSFTEVQQREFIRVILHCLGNEKSYNPYYTLIVQQLCSTSHSHKVTLQYCLWDFLRSLGEKTIGGEETMQTLKDGDSRFVDGKTVSSTKLLNMARAYSWWLAKRYLSITILKPVNFTNLQPQTIEFFETLFSHLFISTQVASPLIPADETAAKHLTRSRGREALEEVFVKATSFSTLALGLTYFITTWMPRGDWSTNVDVSETLKWARDVARDTLRAGMDVIPASS